jgi:hypothetical protein
MISHVGSGLVKGYQVTIHRLKTLNPHQLVGEEDWIELLKRLLKGQSRVGSGSQILGSIRLASEESSHLIQHVSNLNILIHICKSNIVSY